MEVISFFLMVLFILDFIIRYIYKYRLIIYIVSILIFVIYIFIEFQKDK